MYITAAKYIEYAYADTCKLKTTARGPYHQVSLSSSTELVKAHI